MIGIANHDGDGGSWPSIATLARYAGITERNVQKQITALIELGEIVRIVNDGGTHRTPEHMRPNRYRILLRCPAGCDRSTNHRTSQTTPDVAGDTSPPSEATPLPLSVATPEPPEEPSVESSKRANARRTLIPAEFEVTPAMREWARQNHPTVDVDFSTKGFIDYWQGEGAKKADWVATWRNRIRAEAQRNAARTAPAVVKPRVEQPAFIDPNTWRD